MFLFITKCECGFTKFTEIHRWEMEMKTLERAREFEAIHKGFDDSKPDFHVTPGVGWMNDPNGFSLYQGEIHLFYQYYPYGTEWGPMHWGHYKTKDFIKWEALPIALAPDEGYDLKGCFSGSAIEHEGKHVLFYTGVMEKKSDDNVLAVIQNQCIAVGNGVDYRKQAENPVIAGSTLPEGCSNIDFRDPKVWKEDNVFNMVVANRNRDGNGQILLYQSDTLTDWKLTSVLLEYKQNYGKMWECPDFFPLDKKQVLIISPQDMMAQGLEYHNGNNVMYFVGEYCKKTHTLKEEVEYSVDYGLDFYAPQTVLTEDGRRVMIGWMQSWETKLKGADQSWIGMMTIPRELRLHENRLIQSPIRELESYRQNRITYVNQHVEGVCSLDGISGRTIDLTIELVSGDYENFEISFACNEEYRVYCNYNKKTNVLRYDRKYSGIQRDVVCDREVKMCNNEMPKLRLILDKYSAEIFINDGEQVLSSLHFTPLVADGIKFYCDGYVSVNIDKYDIIVNR